MLLSYFAFITDRTQFNRSWQLSFNFGVDLIYTIRHVVILSGFRHSQHLIRSITITQFCFQHRPYLYNKSCLPYLVFIKIGTWYDWSQKFSSIFGIDRTCMIGHFVILSGFLWRRYSSDRSWQFNIIFNVFVQSCQCIIWFSSQTVLVWSVAMT